VATQVGKGAITGWREVLAPNRDRIGIWPFDGTLAECLARTPVVIAETYPGEAYGHLRIGRVPRWSKGSISGRQSVAEKLVAWMTMRPRTRVLWSSSLVDLIPARVARTSSTHWSVS
jgi:hypothetical protein